MKKEIFLAIIIGLIFGLIITYGLYRVRKASETAKTQPTSTTAPTALPNAEPSSLLTILFPEDNIVQEETTTTVTGTAQPNAIVVLFANEEESITTADATGNFSFAVDLNPGSTILTVHALNENGEVVTATRTIVVSSLLSQPAETASESAKEN